MHHAGWIAAATGLLLAAGPARAEVAAIESAALRLEVRSEPYGFRLVAKAAGRTLVEHAEQVFVIGDKPCRAVATVPPAGPAAPAGVLRVGLKLDGADSAAEMRAEFAGPEVLTVTLSCEGAAEVGQYFRDSGEHVYGLWEGVDAAGLDNRGEDRPMVGYGRSRGAFWANARAPFYVTSAGYGIWAETAALGRYAIARDGRTGFQFHGPRLTYHIIYGPTYADVMARYNRLAGPAVLPPLWAFGTVWWRNETRQAELQQDLADLVRLRIPASVFWIDRPFTSGSQGWGNMDWDPQKFPDPKAMMKAVDERGMKLLVWITNRCNNRLEAEGRPKGYLFEGRGWPAADLRRPDAYAWMLEQLMFFPKFGVRGYKIDRGEEGEMPDEVQNELAVLYAKLAAETQSRAFGPDHFIFARSVYDTGRRYVGVWNGDTRTGFAGLGPSVQHALRAAAINMPMWGSDTGGYMGGRRDDEAKRRWLAFSSYSSMCEIMLDNFDLRAAETDPVIKTMQKYTRLHYDLIPYTRSCLHAATRTGMAVMRPMIFEFPGDERFVNTWDQYMYGPSMLVAPVLEAGAAKRRVLLPKGRWLAEDGKTVHAGPAAVEADAPLDVIPTFFREGAIIPWGNILKANQSWEKDWRPRLRIAVFPAQREASSFDYFTGERVETITCTPDAAGIAIRFGDLGCTGSMAVACKDLKAVERNGKRLDPMEYDFSPDHEVFSAGFEGPTALRLVGARSVFSP
jgi:alpha-glucosidase (family GH31 glycosyl hydrolase)